MAETSSAAPESAPQILPPAPAGLALAQIPSSGDGAGGFPQLPPDDPLYKIVQAAHQYMEGTALGPASHAPADPPPRRPEPPGPARG